MTGLTIGLTVFVLLMLGVVIWGFLADERRAQKRGDYLRLSGRLRIPCKICGHVYEDVPLEGLTKCPVCGSFNKIEASVKQDSASNGQEKYSR